MPSDKKSKHSNAIAMLGDSSRAAADYAVACALKDESLFHEFYDLMAADIYPESMRAARVVQLCAEKNANLITPFLDDAAELLHRTKVDGVKRALLKIFAESVYLKDIEHAGTIANTCFEWLASPRQAIAVRYYCLNILEGIAQWEPGIIPELKSTIELLIGETGGGLKGAMIKTLKKCKDSDII